MDSDELSFPDLPLSQETMDRLLKAVSGPGLSGNLFETYSIDLDDDDGGGEDNKASVSAGPGVDDTELRVCRTIIHMSSPGMPQWDTSQSSSQRSSQLTGPSSYHPISTPSSTGTHQITPLPPCHNGSSATCMSQNCKPGSSSTSPSPAAFKSSTTFLLNDGMEVESPLLSNFTFPNLPLSTLQIPPLTSLSVKNYTPSVNQSATSSMIQFQGEYGFDLFFEPGNGKKISKSTNFTYSRVVNRVYVKPNCPASFSFSFTKIPPMGSVVRVTPSFSAPEFVGDKVTCCPTHTQEQREKGRLFPNYFIRAQDKDMLTQYQGYDDKQHLSVVTSFFALQQKTENIRTAIYEFPCVTSNLKKKGQFVQLVFSLECGLHVLGRCVVRIRVCSSPGRDRISDEKKVNGSVEENPNEVSVETRSSRKRSANTADVVEYTMPHPKRSRMKLSEPKINYMINTHRELIPFIDICVKMMEQINSVPVPVYNASDVSDELSSPPEIFSTVAAWLEHVGLSRYSKMLTANGITEIFQISGIEENDLKSWGMKAAAHRVKFLEGKKLVIEHLAHKEKSTSPSGTEKDGVSLREYFESSPPLFPTSPPNPQLPKTNNPPYLTQVSRQTSHGSQLSNSSTQTFKQSFEVLQIHLRKKVSGSSSSSFSQ